MIELCLEECLDFRHIQYYLKRLYYEIFIILVQSQLSISLNKKVKFL